MWTSLLTFIVQEDARVAQLQAELDEPDQALVVYAWLRKRGMSTPAPYRKQLAPQASQALRRWAQVMVRTSQPPPVASWVGIDAMPDFLNAKLHQYVQKELKAGGKPHQLPPLPLPYDMYAEGL